MGTTNRSSARHRHMLTAATLTVFRTLRLVRTCSAIGRLSVHFSFLAHNRCALHSTPLHFTSRSEANTEIVRFLPPPHSGSRELTRTWFAPVLMLGNQSRPHTTPPGGGGDEGCVPMPYCQPCLTMGHGSVMTRFFVVSKTSSVSSSRKGSLTFHIKFLIAYRMV